MFGKRKKQKDHWTLRPGDLPPAEVIAREPRLAGLENNALFRLMIWRSRHHQKRHSSRTSASFWLVLLIIFGGVIGMALALVVAIILFIANRTRSDNATARSMLYNLNIEAYQLHDLVHAAITPVDFTQGVWGFERYRRRSVVLGIQIGYGLQLLSLILYLALFGTVGLPIVLLPVGLINGYLIWAQIVYFRPVEASLLDTFQFLQRTIPHTKVANINIWGAMRFFYCIVIIIIAYICYDSFDGVPP